MPKNRWDTRALPALLFILALGGGIGLVVVRAGRAARRADYVSHLPEWSAETPAPDPSSATGYQDGQRVSIVPGHGQSTFEAIAVAQQMLAQARFRIDRIDYENAPLGRPVRAAPVYPWLLAASAIVHHHLDGLPYGQCVELASLGLDPHLLLVGLIAMSLLAARVFGPLPAALLALGMATLHPFSASFVPGAPNPLGLQALCLLGGLLVLLAGTGTVGTAEAGGPTPGIQGRAPPWSAFAAGGVLGAIGLWLDVPSALPLVGGVFLSGLLLPFLAPAPGGRPLPWRAWGLAGAAVVTLGCLVDGFPARGGGGYRHLHPVYALAWIGAAEILVLAGQIRQQPKAWNGRRIVLGAAALAAFLALPVLLAHTHTDLYTPEGPEAFRLDPVSGIAAPSVASWLARDRFSAGAVATLLPLLAVLLAGLVLSRVDPSRRLAPVLALGPVGACLLVGSIRLSCWTQVDVALLALVVALVAALRTTAGRRLAAISSVVFVLSLAPGLAYAFTSAATTAALARPEFESFLERDVAHWLRQHSASRPEVLAPPGVTSGLCFYGGLAGLGTFGRDNQAGAEAAIRIVSATSAEEAQALAHARQLTYIIIPFWDSYLDTYLRLGLGAEASRERIDGSFLASLRRWQLPDWVRPVPYRLPAGPGVDGTVVILEMVDEQPPAVAAARLAEYFLEMDQPGLAREQVRELARYPNDWGALAAVCAVAAATDDLPALEQARARLVEAVTRPERRRLFWDRRVSLAIILAQQREPALGRAQLEKCLAEIDADKLRSLSVVSLYRFDLLCKIYGTEIADPGLRQLSRALLRADLRSRL